LPRFEPERGEVYEAELEPIVGEQAGRRPFLVIARREVNHSPIEMVVGTPLTTADRPNAMHVRLEPPEGGMTRVSFAMPEMIRWVSIERLRRRLGVAAGPTVDIATRRAGILIGLSRSH
jgi:mRNA interferase MazF